MKEPVPLSRARVGVELREIIQNKPLLNKAAIMMKEKYLHKTSIIRNRFLNIEK